MYNCVCTREREREHLRKRAKDDDDDHYYYLKSSFPDISLFIFMPLIFILQTGGAPTVLTCCWLAVQLVIVVLSSDR